EQALDEILEPGAAGLARGQHALAPRARSIQLAAHRFDAPPQPVDLAIPRVGARHGRQRVDLLQEDRDRFLEFERLSHSTPDRWPRNHKTHETNDTLLSCLSCLSCLLCVSRPLFF